MKPLATQPSSTYKQTSWWNRTYLLQSLDNPNAYLQDIHNITQWLYLFNKKSLQKCMSHKIFSVILKIRVIFLCCQIYSFCFTCQDKFSGWNCATKSYSVLCLLLCYYIDKRVLIQKWSQQVDWKKVIAIYHPQTY